MVCYPEVQKEAQAELDKVLNGRLPEHSDFPSLPYLSALVKEVYRYAALCYEYLLHLVNCVSRWQPLAPLGRLLFVYNIVTYWHLLSRQGLPHQSTSDDLYNDYHIPANSVVIANQWWWLSPAINYWTFLISQTLLRRAMLNDERDYPEPREFKPERFLKNGKLDSSVRDPMDIAFGFGRRWALLILSVS